MKLKKAKRKAAKRPSGKRKAPANQGKGSQEKQVKLLAGGNPQIAKGDGGAPVRAYLAAMPDWKGKIGRRLDSPTASRPGMVGAVVALMAASGAMLAGFVAATFLRGRAGPR